MHRLPADPPIRGHLSDRLAVRDHCEDRLVPLFRHAQCPHVRECQASPGTGVKHHPELCKGSAGYALSRISRICTSRLAGEERIRTFEWRIQSPLPYHLATPQRHDDPTRGLRELRPPADGAGPAAAAAAASRTATTALVPRQPVAGHLEKLARYLEHRHVPDARELVVLPVGPQRRDLPRGPHADEPIAIPLHQQRRSDDAPDPADHLPLQRQHADQRPVAA